MTLNYINLLVAHSGSTVSCKHNTDTSSLCTVHMSTVVQKQLPNYGICLGGLLLTTSVGRAFLFKTSLLQQEAER